MGYLKSRFIISAGLAVTLACGVDSAYAHNQNYTHHTSTELSVSDDPVIDGGNVFNVLSSMARERYEKAKAKIAQNPGSALQVIADITNEIYRESKSPQSKLPIQVKFSNSLPAGDISYIRMGPVVNSQASLQLVVHEAARTNPFFLLDALIQLGNVLDVNAIGYQLSEPIYGANNQIEGFNEFSDNLEKALGLPPLEFSGPFDPLMLLETLVNAEAGSVFSQRVVFQNESTNFQVFKKGIGTFVPLKKLSVAQKRAKLLDYIKALGYDSKSGGTYEEILQKFFDQRDLQYKRKIDSLTAKAKVVYRDQVNQYKSGARERDELDKSKSLSDMIKANDREGVAKAMEVMLPWSIMEPTEKHFWSQFVDSIRKPDYRNAEIIFRGMDNDEKSQSVVDSLGNEIGIGLLSKRLTAGSGSHLYKLRGLPETFESFGTTQGQRKTPLIEPHRLTSMMMNHANAPVGSPFISLTYSLEVAYTFCGGAKLVAKPGINFENQLDRYIKSNKSGGLATIRMDPRRLIVNSVSGYGGTETEVLASMFIFPDEVIYYERGLNYAVENDPSGRHFYSRSAEEYYARAREAVFRKTGIRLPQEHEQLEAKAQDKYIEGVKSLVRIYEAAGATVGKAMSCRNVF